MTKLKKDLVYLIKTIPDDKIEEVYPVFYDFLIKTVFGDNPPVIETDLTDEEYDLIEAGMSEEVTPLELC